MIELHNNGSRIAAVTDGNKFIVSMGTDGMELEMNMTAREMQELIEWASKQLSEMIYE